MRFSLNVISLGLTLNNNRLFCFSWAPFTYSNQNSGRGTFLLGAKCKNWQHFIEECVLLEASFRFAIFCIEIEQNSLEILFCLQIQVSFTILK